MTSSATDTDEISKSTMDSCGLVPNHAYSIIGLFSIHHPTKGDFTLVRLRNPWGRKEWKGAWSEDSPLWTQELKNQLKVRKQEEDGIFYMEFTDFYQFFTDVAICYFHDDYLYSSKTITIRQKNACYFKVVVQTSGLYYFTIN